jgi:hypothetical protein
MGERQETRDDNDKEVWTNMFQEMKHSIDRIQFDLQHHMKETQELFKGKNELKMALTDINTTLKEGKYKITYLLMHMTHGREPQKNGGNNGASGSHGGEGNYTETSHWTHYEGQSLFGGAHNKMSSNSRETPRPYMPIFLDTRQEYL